MLPHLKALFSGASLHAMPATAHTLKTPTAITAAQSHSTAGSGAPAIFASGCFWGIEHAFDQQFRGKGIQKIAVGYIGGSSDNPSYRQVCSGSTGHAESVRIEFDPAQVTYAELVEFHYAMHDPTTVNRQGNDRGTQYRSAIFAQTDEQLEIAKKVTAEVEELKLHKDPIVTQIVGPKEGHKWWDAESYHQRYLDLNPGGYVRQTWL